MKQKLAFLFTVLCGAVSGFAGASLFARPAYPFPVEVAQAPDNSLSLTLKAIRSAEKSIQMNIYQISSPSVANALIQKVLAGVRVEILQEGQTVEGLKANERNVQTRIAEVMAGAGNGSRLYEMRADRLKDRRYRYNHAKYIVIDAHSVLVSSENFNSTGTPRPGSSGNRGWQVLLHSPSVAQTFVRFFDEDARPGARDVEAVTDRVRAFDLRDSARLPVPKGGALYLNPTYEAKSATVITSPETSESGILDLIRSAKSTLDIEQMTFDSDFGGWKESPIYRAVLEAGRRGVKVRVVLNPDYAGQAGTNGETLKRLNARARAERLPLKVVIADTARMGVNIIHNKGVIADGERTLISSINWTYTSVERNRETGVVLASPTVAQYFGRLFERDWKLSQ